MPLSRAQALVTFVVPSCLLSDVAEALNQALLAYPDARVVTLNTQMNPFSLASRGETGVLAVIEYALPFPVPEP